MYSHLGTVFIRFVDAIEYVRHAAYLNKVLTLVIQDVGVDYVIQIITDIDESMKKARMMLMQQRSKTFWSPSIAHCIDLMT